MCQQNPQRKRKRKKGTPSKAKRAAKRAQDPNIQARETIQQQGPATGHGLAHKYKLNKDGEFGKVKIHMPNLQKMMLTAHKHGKRICHQPCDYNLIELLTKRYDPKKKYSAHSVDLFNKLVKHSELPINPGNGKFKHLLDKTAGCLDCQSGGCASCGTQDCKQHGEGVHVFGNEDEAAARLHVLLGEIGAGNNNPELKNEVTQICDWLLKSGNISKEDHKMLYQSINMA